MQIVYISNRPNILLETITQAISHLPYLDQVVVCMPDQQCNEILTDEIAIPITLIPESEILSNKEINELDQIDHQRRNYLLRTRLIEHDAINSRFLMSDDDARPLHNVPIETFVENERYRSYYFYELSAWNNNQTEFDVGQHATFAALNALGLPTLSYASHMPQIIDRALFREATQQFKDQAKSIPLCEWTTYFNYVNSHHPDRFFSPEPYVTLCWPEHPLAWKPFVTPKRYLFENYTPELYRNNAVFGQLELNAYKDSSATPLEKVRRWRQYWIDCHHPEQGKSIRKYLNYRTWINKLFGHVHNG